MGHHVTVKGLLSHMTLLHHYRRGHNEILVTKYQHTRTARIDTGTTCMLEIWVHGDKSKRGCIAFPLIYNVAYLHIPLHLCNPPHHSLPFESIPSPSHIVKTQQCSE